LVALGQLHLDAGDSQAAIATLNKSFTANGASWRTYYLLATAYLRNKEWQAAASAAVSSANLAHSKAAAALLLLGDIQLAAGNRAEAKQTWDKLISTFPNDPLVPEAKKRIVQADREQPTHAAEVAVLALATEPAIVEEHPWAPPDIDSKEYPVSG